MRNPESQTDGSALRPGAVAWRISQHIPSKNPGAVRCVVVRLLPDRLVAVRASTFSAQERRVPQADLFPDREACRAEIIRRRDAKETSS